MQDEYEVIRKNRVRQLRKKAHYDRDAVHRILDAATHVHVAFVEDGAPVVVPMIFGRDGETLYLHGARKARVIRLLEQNDEACLNVTLIDGLVLARSAFNSSMQYRSVTIFGKPVLIDDHAAKIEAMRIISEHTLPGRWEELRAPHDREVKMTGVIALAIDRASAKISDGMPDDDEEDYADPVWAGVLPMVTQSGTLVDDGRLLDGVEASATMRALENKPL